VSPASGEEKQEEQSAVEGEEKEADEGDDDDEANELAIVMESVADKDVKAVDICAQVLSYLTKSKERGSAHNAVARSSLQLDDVVVTNNTLLERGTVPENVLRQAQRLQRLQLLTAGGHIPANLQISNYIKFTLSSNESIIVSAGKKLDTDIPVEVLSAAPKKV
jgi:hypothetical protein